MAAGSLSHGVKILGCVTCVVENTKNIIAKSFAAEPGDLPSITDNSHQEEWRAQQHDSRRLLAESACGR